MKPEPEKGFKSGPVTMRDVALRAGVAPATVSNVLTGRRQVRPELRERVLAAIDELGYRPNRVASSLRSSRSHAIGILVPDLTNPFFATLVHRLEDLAAEDGYQILLASSNEDEQRETERLQMLLSRQIDGLILAPARDATPARAGQRLHLPPTVLMDRGFGPSEFDAVGVDNSNAVRMGCAHLIALGHRDIAFVVNSAAIANMRERIEGYLSALEAAGLGARARIVTGGFTVDSCRAAIEQELRRAEPPTAIFAAVLHRHPRRGEGDPGAGPRPAGRGLAAGVRRFRLDDGAAAVPVGDRPAGRGNGRTGLVAAAAAAEER